MMISASKCRPLYNADFLFALNSQGATQMEFLVLVPVYAYERHSVIGNGFHLPCRSRDPEVNNSTSVDCVENRMTQITVSVSLIILVLTNQFLWAEDNKRNP